MKFTGVMCSKEDLQELLEVQKKGIENPENYHNLSLAINHKAKEYGLEDGDYDLSVKGEFIRRDV